jgi:hypothetical protein
MSIPIAEQDIRERAYALWEARGRAEGTPESDWLAAEEQLKAELDAAASPLPPLASGAADTLEADAPPKGGRRKAGKAPRVDLH